MDTKKILELAKARGVDLSEEVCEQLAKGGAHLIIDLFGEIVKATENKYDDMAYAAIESHARDAADKIQINL